MGQTYRDDPSPHQKFRSMESLLRIASVFTEIHGNSLDVALISITKYQGHSFCNSLTPDVFDTTTWFRLHDLLCSTRYNAHET